MHEKNSHGDFDRDIAIARKRKKVQRQKHRQKAGQQQRLR